jgi:hypothetical protein
VLLRVREGFVRVLKRKYRGKRHDDKNLYSIEHQKPTREFLDSTRLKTQKYPSTVCSDICPPYPFYLLFF